ncbi:MAG: GTP-binding protein [Actinomycetales bacterium]
MTRELRPFPESPVRWPQNRLDGDSDVKIVVTGPFAAGKTTMVTRLGGPGAQVHTETHVSDETAALKAFTTVSLDFASVLVPPPVGQSGTPTQVQLFGTPGQERFEFMWHVLAKGMRGYVVLVDTSRQFSVDDARLILRRFRQISPGTPFVVGVSRWTGKGEPGQLARYLGVDPSRILELMREVDVREEEQSMHLLQHLLAHVAPEPVLVH